VVVLRPLRSSSFSTSTSTTSASAAGHRSDLYGEAPSAAASSSGHPDAELSAHLTPKHHRRNTASLSGSELDQLDSSYPSHYQQRAGELSEVEFASETENSVLMDHQRRGSLDYTHASFPMEQHRIWEFPGWGEVRHITIEPTSLDDETAPEPSKCACLPCFRPRDKLGEDLVPSYGTYQSVNSGSSSGKRSGRGRAGAGAGAGGWGSGGSGAEERELAQHSTEEMEELRALKEAEEERQEEEDKLGQWTATAISGNDITSSCLYVIALCTVAAGKLAPISLLLVVGTLHLFRGIYVEVVTGLPLNGGAYNALLNTTSKLLAAVAACLTLLSYVATAVVSANSSASYAAQLFPPSIDFPVYWATIGILGIFALLNLLGISESAVVALMIFTFHMITLVALVTGSIVFMIQDGGEQFVQNMKAGPQQGNYAADVYFGFCSALLGVSGFESSANFIEEQKRGVFAKTLRNMFFAVAFFNPVISVLSLGVLPLEGIIASETSGENDLLAQMGKVSGGEWLSLWVSVDATIVLSGAVLTGYVGVGGLARRMTLDRCLPQFLLSENPLTKTCHFIIVGFFLITTSLFVIVNGQTTTLAGVYGIAFLGVMALFAVADMLLKYKRARLPRDHVTWWITALIALIAVSAGLIGNIVYDPVNFVYFSVYFALTLLVVLVMFGRIRLLKIFLYFMAKNKYLNKWFGEWIKGQVKEINDQTVIFLTNTDYLSILNKAILYTSENELTHRLIFLHVYQDPEQIPQHLGKHTAILDNVYPKMKLDLVLVRGEFNPRTIGQISERLNVPRNFMFLTCPGNRFKHNLGQFEGVRLITH